MLKKEKKKKNRFDDVETNEKISQTECYLYAMLVVIGLIVLQNSWEFNCVPNYEV